MASKLNTKILVIESNEPNYKNIAEAVLVLTRDIDLSVERGEAV
ncbi:hypothetical protein QNH35_05280 [Bacillus pumilus]|nr:hypothetical protein [Bacillus pumilus]WHX45897.1 hypothetical protein QNH35_05280 [Bacillus pumilus]